MTRSYTMILPFLVPVLRISHYSLRYRSNLIGQAVIHAATQDLTKTELP